MSAVSVRNAKYANSGSQHKVSGIKYTIRTQLCYIIRYYTTYQLHVSAITWPPSGCTKLTEQLYYINSVSNGRRDLTMVRYMNSIYRMVPIFITCMPYTVIPRLTSDPANEFFG